MSQVAPEGPQFAGQITAEIVAKATHPDGDAPVTSPEEN